MINFLMRFPDYHPLHYLCNVSFLGGFSSDRPVSDRSLGLSCFYDRPPQPLSVVRLVVSTDGEQYRVVDVSGAPDGTWIRRHILLKVSLSCAKSGRLVSTCHYSFLFLNDCMDISQFTRPK